MKKPIHLAVIVGEESGDLLGADLVSVLASLPQYELQISGVGGHHLQALGLKSLFDPSEIALMGVSAIIRRLPNLISRINQTAKAIVKLRPDCLLIVDSPEFTHRVAMKVRAAAPDIPIINYVCPSVWAWRPGRAKSMTRYIDHVLTVLPFEPAVLKTLGGPKGTFVGHRLVQDKSVLEAAQHQKTRKSHEVDGVRDLLVLPGSRSSEVTALLDDCGKTIEILANRGHRFNVLMPTVPHVADKVRSGTAGWTVKPQIFEGAEQKWRAFGQADAALAASGTVLLELALVGVPAVSIYRTDPIMRLGRRLITSWTVALPNLIADRAIIAEYLDDMIRPDMLARRLEHLMVPGYDRSAQLEGYSEIAGRMKTIKPSGELAAEVVLEQIGSKK